MTEIAKPSKFRNLAKRTVTGLVLAGVAVAALLAGKSAFWLLVTLLALAMVAEWAKLMGVTRWKTVLACGLIGALMLSMHPLVRPIDNVTLMLLGAIAISVAVIGMSFRLGVGLFYIGLATAAIMFLREESGILLTLWTLSTVWATDVSAYFSGKSIGGPKLAPSFSPNKTWAGLIGGVAGAMLVSAAFVANSALPPWLVPLAGLLAVIAQIGDLYESWLKRRAGVKDASQLFPGHGGALDRLDGLLPVAICVAGLSAAGWI